VPEPDRPVLDLDGVISLDPLLRKYGGRRGRMEPVYAAMLKEAGRLVHPIVVRQGFTAAEVPEIAGQVPHAEQIVLGLCSLGHQLEHHVAQIFPDEPAQAVILDEIGNAWVAGLARQLHAKIRAAAAAEGLTAGPGFRPGIGRWPVELQPTVFHLLKAGQHGIQLTDGLMMDPRKSVSMIVPVGRKTGRSAYAPTAWDS
jgi:hypothetical protein